MEEIKIIKIKDNLIIPYTSELYDSLIDKVQENILNKIEELNAKGVVLDVTGVEILDSYMARKLAETAKMVKLMGASVVLSGMSKDIVLTLVQLGYVITDIPAALNLDQAIQILEEMKLQNQ